MWNLGLAEGLISLERLIVFSRWREKLQECLIEFQQSLKRSLFKRNNHLSSNFSSRGWWSFRKMLVGERHKYYFHWHSLVLLALTQNFYDYSFMKELYFIPNKNPFFSTEAKWIWEWVKSRHQETFVVCMSSKKAPIFSWDTNIIAYDICVMKRNQWVGAKRGIFVKHVEISSILYCSNSRREQYIIP